jgi:hypothetical protein
VGGGGGGGGDECGNSGLRFGVSSLLCGAIGEGCCKSVVRIYRVVGEDEKRLQTSFHSAIQKTVCEPRILKLFLVQLCKKCKAIGKYLV